MHRYPGLKARVQIVQFGVSVGSQRERSVEPSPMKVAPCHCDLLMLRRVSADASAEAVTTFSTVSSAHLRRAGPDGPSREQRERARTAPQVTGRLRSPPYPAAAPASTTARPSASRRVRQSPGKCHSPRAGTPRIVRTGSSSVKGTRRSFLTTPQKRSSGPTLERRRPLPAQRAWRRGPGQRPGSNGARRTSRLNRTSGVVQFKSVMTGKACGVRYQRSNKHATATTVPVSLIVTSSRTARKLILWPGADT